MKPKSIKFDLPSAKEEDLPSLAFIKAGLENIRKYSFEGMEYKEIREVFFNNLKQLPLLLMPKQGLKLPAYRVTDGQYPGFDVTQSSCFSHPPMSACSAGRVNLAHHPVFYASMSPVTAMLEFRKTDYQPLKKGDVIYISSWTIDEMAPGFFTQFIFAEDVSLGQYLKKLNLNNRRKVTKSGSIYSADKQAANKLLIESLSKFFISDENYTISSFLGHYLLYEDRHSSPFKADIVLYPSVQSKLTCINLAIHPDYVAEHLTLKEVHKAVFEGLEGDGARYSLLEIGKPLADGTIEWFKHGYSKDAVRVVEVKILISDKYKDLSYADEPVLYLNNEAYPPLKLVELLIDRHFEEVLTLFGEQLKEYEPDKINSLPISITPGDKSISMFSGSKIIYVVELVVQLQYKSILIKKDV